MNDDKTIVLSTPQGGSIHTFAIDTGNSCTTLFNNKQVLC